MSCSVQKACGGCPTLDLSRKSEHYQKVNRVQKALRQVGLTHPVPTPIAGQNRLGYRNRLRMRAVDGRATLFNRSKLDGCPALRPELWTGINEIIEITEAMPTLLQAVDHLEVRVGDQGDQIGLSLACFDQDDKLSRQSSSAPASLVDHELCSKSLRTELGPNWLISCKAAPKQRSLKYLLNPGLVISIPLNAFVQVNSEVNQMLVGHVTGEVQRLGAATILDLYAGAGNLCLPLIVGGLSGFAVERNKAATVELASRSDTEKLVAIDGNVEDYLDRLPHADVVIVNPPRRGVRSRYDTIAGSAKIGIVLVSCDASSLAADLSEFGSVGFEINHLATFDMFPGTEHIETVATLVRS